MASVRTICTVETSKEAETIWREVAGRVKTLVHISATAPDECAKRYVADGKASELYWVVPDPFKPAANERAMLLQLKDFGCPVYVSTLANLPQLQGTAVLHLDMSYFFTSSDREPWVPLSVFWKRLRNAFVPASVQTIRCNTEDGSVPLRYRYMADVLRETPAVPEATPPLDAPKAGSAAEAALAVGKAIEKRDGNALKDAWQLMVRRDPSTRSLEALDLVYLEKSGRWDEAFRIYDMMLAVEPNWATIPMGRGRALAEMDRWPAAAKDFFAAARLTPKLSADLAYWLGKCAFHHQDVKSAQSYWQVALEENPEHALSRLALSALPTNA